MVVNQFEGILEESQNADEGGLKWYVLRTVRGHEKKVKASIETKIEAENLQEFVPRVLIPIEKTFQVKNGKKITREKACYSGYVFVEADLSQGEAKHILRHTPSVLGFLGNEDKAEALRQQEVMRLLGIVDGLEDAVEAAGFYLEGEAIKVIDGPFNNFEGVIEEVNNEKRKLKVTVKIFGRKTPLELNFSQVEKLS